MDIVINKMADQEVNNNNNNNNNNIDEVIHSIHFPSVLIDESITRDKLFQLYRSKTNIFVYCKTGKQFYQSRITGVIRHNESHEIRGIRIHFTGYSLTHDTDIFIPSARIQLSNPYIIEKVCHE